MVKGFSGLMVKGFSGLMVKGFSGLIGLWGNYGFTKASGFLEST
jgi:hypothetical protein